MMEGFEEIIPICDVKADKVRVWKISRMDVKLIVKKYLDKLKKVADSFDVDIEVVDGGFLWKYPGKPDVMFSEDGKVFVKIEDMENRPRVTHGSASRAVSILYKEEFLLGHRKWVEPVVEVEEEEPEKIVPSVPLVEEVVDEVLRKIEPREEIKVVSDEVIDAVEVITKAGFNAVVLGFIGEGKTSLCANLMRRIIDYGKNWGRKHKRGGKLRHISVVVHYPTRRQVTEFFKRFGKEEQIKGKHCTPRLRNFERIYRDYRQCLVIADDVFSGKVDKRSLDSARRGQSKILRQSRHLGGVAFISVTQHKEDMLEGAFGQFVYYILFDGSHCRGHDFKDISSIGQARLDGFIVNIPKNHYFVFDRRRRVVYPYAHYEDPTNVVLAMQGIGGESITKEVSFERTMENPLSGVTKIQSVLELKRESPEMTSREIASKVDSTIGSVEHMIWTLRERGQLPKVGV